MQLVDIIKLLEDEKINNQINIKNRKNNINSSYDLAIHDFRVIDNMEDVYETLDIVIDILNNCQERIVKRNRICIRDYLKSKGDE